MSLGEVPNVEPLFGVAVHPDIVSRFEGPGAGYIYACMVFLWLVNAVVVWKTEFRNA